jgi:hypothetical protein
MYGHGTYTSESVQLHNHTSFPIRPDQPCNAGESQLRAEAAPSEQPPSWHQSFQLTYRVPRRGLPRPNCHSHGFTSYTLLPRLPSAAAVSQMPTWTRPLMLAVLVRPARNKGISGTLPSDHIAGATIRQGVGKGSYIGHPSTLHGPADGQFQLLKGAEEVQVVTEVVRAASVGCTLWGLPPVGHR